MKLSGPVLRVILLHQKEASQNKSKEIFQSLPNKESIDEEDKFTDSDSEGDDESHDDDPVDTFPSKPMDSQSVPVNDKQLAASQIEILPSLGAKYFASPDPKVNAYNQKGFNLL